MESVVQITHRTEMETQEILRLYSEGHRLVCRFCKVEFSTIPESLALGQRPIHVVCPNNPNHMQIHADPSDKVSAMRRAMREMKGQHQ
jgi:hypothetical protein